MQGTYTEKIRRQKPSDFTRRDSKRDKNKNKRYFKERDRKRNFELL